jgi:hypothetical protein
VRGCRQVFAFDRPSLSTDPHRRQPLTVDRPSPSTGLCCRPTLAVDRSLLSTDPRRRQAFAVDRPSPSTDPRRRPTLAVDRPSLSPSTGHGPNAGPEGARMWACASIEQSTCIKLSCLITLLPIIEKSSSTTRPFSNHCNIHSLSQHVRRCSHHPFQRNCQCVWNT